MNILLSIQYNPLTYLVRCCQQLSSEKNLFWKAVILGLSHVNTMLKRTPAYGDFKRYHRLAKIRRNLYFAFLKCIFVATCETLITILFFY
jgi:hypothetical protein